MNQAGDLGYAQSKLALPSGVRAVLPLLKSSYWLEKNSQPLIVLPWPEGRQASQADAPSQLLMLDQGEHIAYLRLDTYPEIPVETLRTQALANLREELASLTWERFDPDSSPVPYDAAAFVGHFNAAEAILLPERLQEAHALLDSQSLVVSVPCRGVLLALALDQSTQLAIEVFAAVAHENATDGNNEAISDLLWFVKDGIVIGLFDPIKHGEQTLLTSEAHDASLEKATNSKTHTTLYTPFQIALAGFFGTVLAGLWCLNRNYRYFSDVRNQRLTIVAILLLVPLSLALFAVIPDTPVDRLFPLATAVLMYGAAQFLQGQQITAALKRGAMRHSFWRVAVVIVMSLALVLTAMITVAQLLGMHWTRPA